MAIEIICLPSLDIFPWFAAAGGKLLLMGLFPGGNILRAEMKIPRVFSLSSRK